MDFNSFKDKLVGIFSSKFEEAKDAAVEAIAEVQAAAEEEVAAAVAAAKVEAATPVKPAFSGKVQATVREGGVVHFQAGKLGAYTKGDVTDSELAAAVGQQLAYGTDVGTSFFGSKTRYVPVTLTGDGFGELSNGLELELPESLEV